MYTETYDQESNKINIDKIIDNIDLDSWDYPDEDDHYFDDEEWDLNNEEI